MKKVLFIIGTVILVGLGTWIAISVKKRFTLANTYAEYKY